MFGKQSSQSREVLSDANLDMSAPAIESSNIESEPVPADLLLNALQKLARFWQKPDSAERLTAGLPLDHGRMTPALVPEAMARIGVSVNKLETTLRELEHYQFPVIYSTGGDLVVCLQREGKRQFRCYDPRTGTETLVSARQLNDRERQVFLSFLPELENASASKTSASAKGWLRRALASHWRSVAYVFCAATLINLFAIAMPLFTLNVYDRVLPNEAISTLWVLGVGLALVLVFDLALKLARAAVINHIGRQVDLRLSSALFDQVLNTKLDARPKSTGDFVNQVGQYEVLREFLASSTLVTFIDALFIGVFALVIYQIVGWIVLLPLGAGTIAIVISLLASYLSKAPVADALKESSTRNSLLVETLSAAQTVKASRAEGQFLRKWEQVTARSTLTQMQVRRIQAFASNATTLLGQLSMAGIVIAGTYRFSAGDITMGAIIASMMLSGRLIGPISQIASTLLRTRAAAEAHQVIDGIMKLEDERGSAKSGLSRAVTQGRVQFNKVRFAYPNSNVFVLDGISFDISPGEKVGIIGPIGSGKTTLGRLMVNFHNATEGEILINNVAIDQYHPAELRRGVGLVLQDPELFIGTVRENILMSDPLASEERFLDACVRAGVEAFVSRHPEGYDMQVGERGRLLSGGQRQTIALARAIMADPMILFLDEPSSAMDAATEKRLVSNLEASLKPHQTVLVATHRMSLLSLVTRLIVLENGKIALDGPKESVLSQLQKRGGGV